MSLTVGSLFAGIGGIELGLERAGMEVVWQVEKDDYCREVLAKHWPDVERYEDVRDVGAVNLEPVDLICGGFPCQDISVAGKGEGIEGERSGLWSEMWRIIRQLRPRYAVMENVSALRHRGLGRLLGDLAEIGYDARWESLPAGLFGAPHIRERVFVVGYPHRSRQSDLTFDDEAPRLPKVDSDPQHASRERGGALGRAWRGRKSLPWDERGDCTDPALAVRVADGVPSRVDRLRALGNAVVPQVAEWVGGRIVEHAETTP